MGSKAIRLSEQEKTLVRGIRSGRFVLNAAVTASVAPAVIESKPRFLCITPGCYKAGHAFSQAGAYGTPGVAKGHFDLNPTHTAKAV